MTLRSILVLAVLSTACAGDPVEDTTVDMTALSAAQKLPRYTFIRDAARARGIDHAFMLAGIANDETGLAMCWSEATWACQGPASPDCGGGPIIAGSGDGPCSIQQGGLGMFQFDAGTYGQTLAKYGNDVLTLDGQVHHAIDYVVAMVRRSVYTTNAETDAAARQWLNNFDVNNPTLRDQWIKTVIRYYNGCQPTSGCWSTRYQTYADGLDLAIAEPGGLAFWGAGGARNTAIAFQANTGALWTTGSVGTRDWSLGLASDTSPSVATLTDGGFQIAFQSNNGVLWTTGSAGTRNWGLGLAPGTSPSIAALANGGYQVAFQANTGSLWTVGTAGARDWSLGLATKTSPSITGLAGGGFQVAFQANTSSLWTVGSAGARDWQLGLAAGTSPSITSVGGGFQVAFQANTGHLWSVGTAEARRYDLGLASGTSPRIAGLTNGGFEIAFQANTGSLWTTGTAGTKDWALGMKAGTSPAISALANGGYQVAIQANTGSLWRAGTNGIANLELGLAAKSSPASN